MLNFFMAGPDLVRWELTSLGSNGPYRLAIHHAAGSIVEHFDDVTAALLRQGELEEVLLAARGGATSAPDASWVDVESAETMAFITLSLCELLRAFTVRSERLSLFQIGPFSNRYLVGAVALSIFLLLLTVFVPFLQPVFNTHALTWTEWQVVLGLALIPAVSEEVTKFFLRRKKVTR